MLFIAVTFAFNGCSKDDPTQPGGGDNTLSLSVNSLSANSKGTKTSFSITASGSWSVTGGDGWCTVSPNSGKGNATVNVDIAENPSASDRTTKITVTSGQLKREIDVTQSEKSTILLTGRSCTIECPGGKVTVELKSNISFDIIMPQDAGWISHLGTKALTTNTVEFGIAENIVASPRSAKVIFREKGGTLADTLTINQGEYYFVHCVFSKIYQQKSESALNVKIQSSVESDYAIIEGQSWITMTNYDASKTTYRFTFAANPGENNRFGKVRFFRKGGGSVADTMEIKQSGFDGYYVHLNYGQRIENAIPVSYRPSVTKLKIEGELTEADFATIRNSMRHLEVIDLSESVLPDKSIPEVAFDSDETIYMALRSVVLPEGVERIEYAAFDGCRFITSINLPSSIKSIGRVAFKGCIGLTGHIELPASLESISGSAFNSCSYIESITLPKNLKSIEMSAFSNCGLFTVIALMENPFELSTSCFDHDGRKVLVVPKGKKDIYASTAGWNNTNIFKKIVESGDTFEDFVRCDKKSLMCYSEVNSENFKIESSSGWKIDSKPSWVTLSKSVGNNGETITATVSPLGSLTFREGKIVISLQSGGASTELTIYQHSLSFGDGSWVKLQSASRGAGIDLVFMGDGYTVGDISAGKYVSDMNSAVSYFFDIEPYRSYREYFNVYMVYAFSQESGISIADKKVTTRFETKVPLVTSTYMSTNTGLCYTYARKVPLVNPDIKTVILIANLDGHAGTCWMNSDGNSVSICAKSPTNYPFDFRGTVQHEACGHGFGQLADEYVNKTGMVPASEVDNLRMYQEYGMFLNVDATSDRSAILWKHFFSDPLYSYVGAYEGGYYYPQGIWRPESGSLMINNIRYINAPSREIIVKRIKRMAGEQFSFTEFRAKDRDEQSAATKAASLFVDPSKFLAPPIIEMR